MHSPRRLEHWHTPKKVQILAVDCNEQYQQNKYSEDDPTTAEVVAGLPWLKAVQRPLRLRANTKPALKITSTTSAWAPHSSAGSLSGSAVQYSPCRTTRTQSRANVGRVLQWMRPPPRLSGHGNNEAPPVAADVAPIATSVRLTMRCQSVCPRELTAPTVVSPRGP